MAQIKLKSGNHSFIKLVSLLKNDTYVEKIYGKKTIIGQKTIAVLFNYFLKYKKIAHSIELPICDTSYNKIIEGSKNSYIIEFQSYIGTNFEDFILKESNPRVVILYIEKYLLIFKKVWEANFPIGVDPLLRNFGIDADGELKYFDFFPPHQKISNAAYFFWPEPSIADRKFFIDRTFSCKQAQVIYLQLLRHLVVHRYMSPQELKHLICAVLGENTHKYLQISREMKMEALSKPHLHDIDLIRIITCELCYEKKITHNQLIMIFKYTHIGNQNILATPEKINTIVKMLKKVF